MSPLLVAGLAMILLHRADGGEVAVIPSHITALHEGMPPESGNRRLIIPEARCVVWLDDAKRLSVRETCSEIKQLLGEAR